MPTLTWLDSFAHQNVSATFYGTNAGVYDNVNNPSVMSFVTGRRVGSFALQHAQDGLTATRVQKSLAAGNRTIVESFYFKVNAAPSVDSKLWSGTGFINSYVGIKTSTGELYYNSGSGSDRINTGVNSANGLWHRIDLKWVTSATPYTLDVTLDGVALTQQVSNATTIADITVGSLGSVNATHTMTVAFADWVRSLTGGDHPIGAHKCQALIPNADGAHNWTSTHMGPASGGVASSVTTLWDSVDDWPASATDYIQYALTTATSTEYAEITLPDENRISTIWAARAIAAILSSGTAANSATTRVVDGAGATALDLYVGDQSDTTMRFQAGLIPSITTNTLLNALKFRVGFPTDSNPAPWWAALMIDYASPDTLAPPMESRGRRNSMRRTRV